MLMRLLIIQYRNLQRDICTLGNRLERNSTLNSALSNRIIWMLSKFFIVRRPVKKVQRFGMGTQIENIVDIMEVHFQLTFVLYTTKNAGGNVGIAQHLGLFHLIVASRFSIPDFHLPLRLYRLFTASA